MSSVDQRQAFVDAYLKRESSMRQLCRQFGISRKTGYKWATRYLAGCELVDRSRRPKSSPRAVAQALEDAIVAARRQRPTWGPRKLRAVLRKAYPDVRLPSVSTIALIFHRNGLIVPRRRRRRVPRSSVPLAHAHAPNAVWCIDFKGDFVVGRGRCYPLTVTDAYSRYLLACVALGSTRSVGVQRALEQVFRAFGLPAAIRSDNGAPFASVHGPGGLSELSAWWHALGIRHERIEPGKPQQNGRHERFHLTLKRDTPLGGPSLRHQQRAFDRFRCDYNQLRPHEALGQQPPEDFYAPSTLHLPDPPWGRDFDYPEHFEVARVRRTGRMAWNGRTIFVSTVLRHRLLGLEWMPPGHWNVHFGSLPLGQLRRTGRRFLFVRNDHVRSASQPTTLSPMSLERRHKLSGVSPMSLEQNCHPCP
jgi:transposase InsO family protein